MIETKKIIKLCEDCGACVQICSFLKYYCKSPKELANRFIKNPMENMEVLYSCSLCGLCHTVCKQDLNPGMMCMEARKELFTDEHKQFFPEYFVYDFMIPKMWSIRTHQFLSSSPFFTYHKGNSDTVFFPGCSLSAYSPHIVLKSYKYLQKEIPGTGIMLNCCGKPTLDTGDVQNFEKIFSATFKKLAKYNVKNIILTCINCQKVFEDNSDIKVYNIYEILDKKGLPQQINGKKEEITIHDSCPARHIPKLRTSVRNILKDMNFTVSEMKFANEKTMCCGGGGCSTLGNTALSFRHTQTRAKQANNMIVTYCAHCRERYSSYNKSFHILDIIFGSNDKKRLKEYNDSWHNWLNRWYLKKRLQIR